MVYIALLLLGLILGSFVNALVWRIHEQESGKKDKKLSITKGRSICPNCKHQLSSKDLIPLLSWLWLKRRCRYCHKHISSQYPLVEALTATLFLVSYVFWPYGLQTVIEVMLFIAWLPVIVGFVALSVYDIKWFILPNRIIYPLWVFVLPLGILNYENYSGLLTYLLGVGFASLIGGGIFYAIYLISKGKWIGGGDIRLGWMLGFIAATPARSVLFIFIASLLGTFISMLLMSLRRYKKHQLIPFGPFLMAGLFIVQLFGEQIIDWYLNTLVIT